MSGKQLWLLAGGNGAGKSTFFEQFLRPRGIAFVNADRIARVISPDAPQAVGYDAARLGERLRYELLDRGASFCFETVFSHVSKVDFVANAKAAGYSVIIVLIHLESPALNLARVAQRVRAGGHAVAEDKVLGRIPRTMSNIRRALPLSDEAHLLDNSSCDDPFRRIASLVDGELTLYAEPLPSWARDLLADHLV